MTGLMRSLLAAAGRHPERPALTDPAGRTVTYRQLSNRIRGVAAGLREHGLQTGDRMLFSVRPSVSGICLALGCAAAGGAVVFADPGVGRELFTSRLDLARPAWAAAESVLYALGRPGPGHAVDRGPALVGGPASRPRPRRSCRC